MLGSYVEVKAKDCNSNCFRGNNSFEVVMPGHDPAVCIVEAVQVDHIATDWPCMKQHPCQTGPSNLETHPGTPEPL